MSTISMVATDVRKNMPWWTLGQPVESGYASRTAINSNPQAKQVTTVTLTDQGDSLDITITINGFDVVLNSGTGGDAASIGALLAAAINADQRVRGQVSASFDTVTLTLTGETPGVTFTVSIANDANSFLSSVTAVTAAASAAAIDFGRAVCRTSATGGQGTDDLVALAASSLFTAQVQTITVTYVASAVLTCRVYEVRGNERYLLAETAEVSATSRDATLDALVAAINTELPANSVVATADNATATAIIFTAEVAGLEFVAEISASNEGASIPDITSAATTGPSESTSFHRAWKGVALASAAEPAATVSGTETQYAGNSSLPYMTRGVIPVESAEAITAGADVYVELGVTADNGKFFAADSATRIAIGRSRAEWELDANNGTGSLAALRLK